MCEVPMAVPIGNAYTVVLLYPDYLAASYGETFVETTVAEYPQNAVFKVQQHATRANQDPDDDGFTAAPQDFHPAVVMKGECEIVPI